MKLVVPINTSGGHKPVPRGLYHIPQEGRDITWCGIRIPPRWLRKEADPESDDTITVCSKCTIVHKQAMKPLELNTRRRSRARSTA